MAAGAELPARVLPSLAFPIPMETKLRQGGGNLWRLFILKLNPNPLAHYLRQFPKTRCLVVEQVQEFFRGKSPVLESEFEINPMRLVFNALCGPVQDRTESEFETEFVFVFIVFFLQMRVRSRTVALHEKACGTGRPAGVVFRGHRVRPPVESRLVEGDRLGTHGKKHLKTTMRRADG